jgi:hypothetical protein
MNYRRPPIALMMSARTAVISKSALPTVSQCWHLKTTQFHCVLFGAKALVVSIANANGLTQFGFGQTAISVSNFDFREEILA